ncbi:GNAT family N-acetyltransferase [Ornithinimicrobium humiphilum]|uniref:Acetyltransferase (GNAT) family protein n=1 Tax=Ornithinimicrobium humiphilum TaxID=125288 RepID=A0A543KNZ1_9MICO|nr:GNAT family N-acetyltransferase [Ornithinimicrobium humiphilum]TQM96782.1 acetyltransferase (GNAT) family protein [Ornithinimicrobium humiphilum]
MTETTTQGAGGTDLAAAYRWAPLTEADVPAWADLVNHLARVDGTEEFLGEEELQEELTFSGFTPATDSIAVWDGDVMVAYAKVGVPVTPDHEGSGRGYVEGGVREEHRRRGLGTRLMDLLEPRAAELVAERHPGRTAYLRAGGGLQGSSASAMLERRGYAVVRWFNLLERPLGDVPEVPEVEGVSFVVPQPEHEEPVRVAHNEAFRDHWGSGPSAPEPWHDHWTTRAARQDVSTLAVSEDGEVLAYVLCGEYQPRELYVNLVGTVPQARGRGIAAAALLTTIAAASRSGAYDTIQLDVDSDSITGATRLYERVGFGPKLSMMSMQRPLPL